MKLRTLFKRIGRMLWRIFYNPCEGCEQQKYGVLFKEVGQHCDHRGLFCYIEEKEVEE